MGFGTETPEVDKARVILYLALCSDFRTIQIHKQYAAQNPGSRQCQLAGAGKCQLALRHIAPFGSRPGVSSEAYDILRGGHLRMPSQQAKNWCFTLNNYGQDGEKRVLQRGAENESVCYMVVGKEIGESGTPHLQGYVQFSKRFALGSVKRIVGERAHCEVSRGTPQQAAEYCKKDGDFKEIGGIRGGQGARSDLSEVYKACRKGATFEQIGDTYPSAALRYGSGIQRIRQLSRPARESAPTIWVFWGMPAARAVRTNWRAPRTIVGNDWNNPGRRRCTRCFAIFNTVTVYNVFNTLHTQG